MGLLAAIIISVMSTIPCQDQASRTKASAEVDALAALMRSMRTDADAASWLSALSRTLTHACFELVALTRPDFEEADPASLHAWWRRGGESWLRSVLDTQRAVTWPPDHDRSVARLPKEVRVLLGCESKDCREPTASWVSEFERWASTKPPSCTSSSVASPRDCGRGADESKTLSAWLTCVHGARKRIPALPVGGSRAPTGGWLLLADHLTSYDSCDALTALHVETGAVYSVRRCCQRADGSHRFGREGCSWRTDVRSGGVDPSLASKLVWVLVMVPHVTERSVRAERVVIPEGVELDLSNTWIGPLGGCGWSMPGERRWRYVDGENRIDGMIELGSTRSPAAMFADSVAAALEQSRKPGCPPAQLPAQIVNASRTLLFMKSDGGAEAELRSALHPFTTDAGCR